MKQFNNIYSNADSFLHKWTAPLKISAFLFYAFAMAFITNWIIISGSLLISFTLILFFSANSKMFFHQAKNLLFFVIAISFLLLFSKGKEILVETRLLFIPIRIYKDALNFSLLIILRSFSVFMIFFLLLSTTKINAILHSLIFFRVPQNISLIFFLTYRYFHKYIDDLGRMKTAMSLKGYSGSKKRIVTAGRLYGNLLIRSYEDTDRVFKAMILRGLTEKKPESMNFKYSILDLILFYSFAFLGLIFIFLDKLFS